MRAITHLKSFRSWLAVFVWALTVATALAQPPDSPAGAGGPGGFGRQGRGGGGFGGPQLSESDMAMVNTINNDLRADVLAVNVASSNLIAATYSLPKDDGKIAAANTALMNARMAWAKKASEVLTKVQASTNKLSDAAVARLVATAPGAQAGGGGRGRRGGRGGFGGGGGFGGPGGGGPDGRGGPGQP